MKKILVFRNDIDQCAVYEGYVEQVGDQDVYLQVSTSFLDSFLKNMKFDIG